MAYLVDKFTQLMTWIIGSYYYAAGAVYGTYSGLFTVVPREAYNAVLDGYDGVLRLFGQTPARRGKAAPPSGPTASYGYGAEVQAEVKPLSADERGRIHAAAHRLKQGAKEAFAYSSTPGTTAVGPY